MKHYPPLFLTEGRKSAAYYSTGLPKNLIVFVHGFNGDATQTWTDFIELSKSRKRFDDCDMLYYGYDSLKGQVYGHALNFYKFVSKYNDHRFPMGEEKPTNYDNIVIVAHSLGAIVSRFAVLEAISRGTVWYKKCKLVYFAPAHNGARVQKLLFMGLPGFWKLLGSSLLYRYPIIDDLQPNSAALEKLEEMTISYKNKPEQPFLTAHVIHGGRDRVVNNLPYCYDIMHIQSPVSDKDHIGVCKSETRYLTPIQIIENFV